MRQWGNEMGQWAVSEILRVGWQRRDVKWPDKR